MPAPTPDLQISMLISAIMPTRSRPEMSRVALACFLAQDYKEKELVILDDEDDPSFPMPPDEPGVRYFRAPRRTIGAKREALCELALGDVIIHFDSDDWSAPGRMSAQVARLEGCGKGLTGYNSLLFWDCRNNLGYRWTWDGTGPLRHYTCGTSMCYTRDWWKAHRWPDKREASDHVLVTLAQWDRTIDSTPDGGMCVARAHTNNTSSAARIGQNGWPLVAREEFPKEFFEAIEICA